MMRHRAAVGRARLMEVASQLGLEADELARAGASILFDAGRRCGLDRRGLHAILCDVAEAASIDEGRRG